MGVATFDFDRFLRRYPVFEGLDKDLAQDFFDEATLYWKNDGSISTTDAEQSVLLNALCAHIAVLNVQVRGDANPGEAKAPGMVGRLSSATQGSVTVQTDLALAPSNNGLQAWLMQTQFGMAFWAATAAWRSFTYVQGTVKRGFDGVLNPYPGVE